MKHKFVEFIPEKLEDGVVYVAMEFGTVVHKCCCGCGNEVNTPLSPTDWKLTYDGESISLHPSIGNWGFSCQSHYWITRNKVKWSGQWTKEEIQTGRKLDRLNKVNYYKEGESSTDTEKAIQQEAFSALPPSAPKSKFWAKLLARVKKLLN